MRNEGRLPSSVFRLPSLRDDRGVAATEAMLVLALLGGVFFAGLLLARWSTSLQSAQMGARLLAFDAGDVDFAKLGKPSRTATRQLVAETWDTLVDTLVDASKSGWLTGMFALTNTRSTNRVTGSAQGRMPGQKSVFDYSPATMAYHASGWATASNPWGIPESVVRSSFLRIAFNVGRYQVDTSGFVSMVVQPLPTSPAILETIFGRAGIQ
jgi:hypothetical protein